MLYPGVFPNLAGLTAARADLVAILLTGLPVRGRSRLPELHRVDLRRRTAPEHGDPGTSSNPNPVGLVVRRRRPGSQTVGGVFDDVVTIELRAIAGLTYPLVDAATRSMRRRRAITTGSPTPTAPTCRPSPTSGRRRAAIRPRRSGSSAVTRRGTAWRTRHAATSPASARRRRARASRSTSVAAAEHWSSTASERFRGREIEISRVDVTDRRVHTGVHERGSDAGSRLTAIFGSLPAGRYVIWEDDDIRPGRSCGAGRRASPRSTSTEPGRGSRRRRRRPHP